MSIPAAALLAGAGLTGCASPSGSSSTSVSVQVLSSQSSVAAGTPGTASRPASSAVSGPPAGPGTAPSSPPPATSAASEPDCTQPALQDAVNADRPADSQLTVGADFLCQDGWAVAAGTDVVNRAQYTFVLRWIDGRWQRVPDRAQACADRTVPAQLAGPACASN